MDSFGIVKRMDCICLFFHIIGIMYLKGLTCRYNREDIKASQYSYVARGLEFRDVTMQDVLGKVVARAMYLSDNGYELDDPTESDKPNNETEQEGNN